MAGRAFERLYRGLPAEELYRSDGLNVYRSWLSAARSVVGKGREMNRNEGLHSFLRRMLSRAEHNRLPLSRSAAASLRCGGVRLFLPDAGPDLMRPAGRLRENVVGSHCGC